MHFCDTKCCYGSDQCKEDGIHAINHSKYHKVCSLHIRSITYYSKLTCSYCNSLIKVISSLLITASLNSEPEYQASLKHPLIKCHSEKKLINHDDHKDSIKKIQNEIIENEMPEDQKKELPKQILKIPKKVLKIVSPKRPTKFRRKSVRRKSERNDNSPLVFDKKNIMEEEKKKVYPIERETENPIKEIIDQREFKLCIFCGKSEELVTLECSHKGCNKCFKCQLCNNKDVKHPLKKKLFKIKKVEAFQTKGKQNFDSKCMLCCKSNICNNHKTITSRQTLKNPKPDICFLCESCPVYLELVFCKHRFCENCFKSMNNKCFICLTSRSPESICENCKKNNISMECNLCFKKLCKLCDLNHFKIHNQEICENCKAYEVFSINNCEHKLCKSCYNYKLEICSKCKIISAKCCNCLNNIQSNHLFSCEDKGCINFGNERLCNECVRNQKPQYEEYTFN